MTKRKALVLAMAALICIAAASCRTHEEYPVEPLGDEEYTYYADNLNCFGDDVKDSGTAFMYVVLPFDEKSGLSDDDMAVAGRNADGIIGMASGNYLSVLDLKDSLEGPADVAFDKLGLKADAKLLLIGDAAAKSKMLEALSSRCSVCDYRDSQGVDDAAYDELYKMATSGSYDAVIVANDAAAYHAGSFPYSAE